MKTATSVLLLFAVTCLALGMIVLFSHAQGEDQPEGTTPSTTPTTEATGSTTIPSSTPVYNYSYSEAEEELLSAGELFYTYTFEQTRLVGEDVYSEIRTGNAAYTGLQDGELEALIREDVAYGSYSTHLTEAYRNGVGYSQVRGSSFVCDLTAGDFLARQVPALVITKDLYQKMDTSEDHLSYTFSEPTGLESWVDPTGEAVLVSAGGVVALDTDGRISTATYEAEYTLGTVRYTLKVSVAMTDAPEQEEAQPEFPEACPVISDMEIPRYMLRTVGGVYHSKATSADYEENVYFGVLQESQTKTGGFYTHGEGEQFLAELHELVVRANVTGSSSASSLNNTFRDGQYGCVVNGGEPYIDANHTADSVRELCENSILESLMILSHIGSAEMNDVGEAILISFEGNESFVQYFSGKIYAMYDFTVSLDILADSCSTENASGYLMIDKYSGLPMEMGLSLERTHVFDGIANTMTYERDQTVTLSCPKAYETITGKSE